MANAKSMKRFPYIEVDGVSNEIIDACLLRSVPLDSLSDLVKKDTLILQKTKLSKLKLSQRKYSQTELVATLAPFVKASYNFYNFLANVESAVSLSLFNEDDLEQQNAEQWVRSFAQLFRDEPASLFCLVNEIRFHAKSEYHFLIKTLLEYYYDIFEKETGITLGAEFQKKQKRPSLENEEKKGMKQSEKISFIIQLLKELEEESRLYDELAVQEMSVELESLRNEIEQLREANQKWQEKYEAQETHLMQIKNEQNLLRNEIKSKEQTLSSTIKQLNETRRKNENITNQLEELKKENGRLGQVLGEIRKQVQTLEKEKAYYEKRVQTLEKEKETLMEQVEKDLENKWRSQIALLKDNYEKTIQQLELEIEQLRHENESTKLEKTQSIFDNETVNALMEEIKHLRSELKQTKEDLRVVERERELLAQHASSTGNESVETKEEDSFFLGGLMEFNPENI
jgi:DNA repair exonuclease SbcCD ATPase subunit